MSLFHRQQSYLGVDFGSGSIKLVELAREHGKPRLKTYGLVEVGESTIRDQSPEGRKRTAALLGELIKRTKAQAKEVIAGIPDFSVFTAVIRLPAMPDKDLRQAVVWEAKKIIPLPLEEVNIDWQIVGDGGFKNNTNQPPESGSKTLLAELPGGQKQDDIAEEKKEQEKEQDSAAPSLRVLLTAAPKNVVNQYISTLKEAGLTVASLETESFALIRSLVGYDPSTVLLTDIGSVVTHMVIVEKDIPILTRSIDVGGKTISQAIANVMGVEVRRAEQFKRLHGIPLRAEEATAGLPQAIVGTVQNILQEIRYLIETHARQSEGKVEKVILTGGSALLPGLENYFEKHLNVRVFVGDPFARVVYPLDLQPVLQQIGPRLSVAAGLAMWGTAN